MYNPEKSFKNAEKLLDSQDVVSLRIEPEPRTCCCSDCWPLVWQNINEFIYPQGPIEHESKVLVKIDNERYVLEQHESGPEIVLLITTSINLMSAIINLIVAICHSLKKERKCPTKIKIVRRQFLHKQVTKDLLVEINLNDSNITLIKMKSIIETTVKKALTSKKR